MMGEQCKMQKLISILLLVSSSWTLQLVHGAPDVNQLPGNYRQSASAAASAGFFQTPRLPAGDSYRARRTQVPLNFGYLPPHETCTPQTHTITSTVTTTLKPVTITPRALTHYDTTTVLIPTTQTVTKTTTKFVPTTITNTVTDYVTTTTTVTRPILTTVTKTLTNYQTVTTTSFVPTTVADVRYVDRPVTEMVTRTIIVPTTVIGPTVTETVCDTYLPPSPQPACEPCGTTRTDPKGYVYQTPQNPLRLPRHVDNQQPAHVELEASENEPNFN